ncbi:TetR/AcrR family transcriptional regulator [Adhaeribacter radiodurans]|uniref:TetR/AcrR family transcriptional regulator n=1 Tax=Adhaeribacter radiodurans TaxID=2745197 RepID=A0A7L7L7W6_9BACT|nr:TetR/AcrR family transcriptional regulator [Adhaeribacter radiodurans]QMU28888.1 TetR/AcrR family transcriptional regulator [Adhaeribacter radiodurans]
MGIIERKQRQKEEVRGSILQAAWALVLAEGWQALSIRKIAEAIEYSVPVIYNHFENKEAILQEFTKEGFRLLNLQLEEAKLQHDEPSTQLEALAHAYWNFAFANKEYYQLMYGLGMPTCETVRQTPEMKQFSNILQETIKELINSGKNPKVDYFLKFHTFWSMLHGLISINLTGRSEAPDKLNQLILQDAIQGFIKNIS